MDRSALVRQYAQAWSATTAQQARDGLAPVWTSQSTYMDPITDPTRGIEELVSAIINFGAQFPGAKLMPTSLLDTHHNVGRFSWVLKMPAPVTLNGVTYGRETEGFDFVEFAHDGSKILSVIGFFGPFRRSI